MKIKNIMINNLNEENFNENIQQPILVDFWSNWCGSCKMLSLVLEKINFNIGKIDVDENENLARTYDILNLPILFENGKEIKRFTGFKSKDQIEDFLS
jgi:thioredoxin